MSVAAWDSLISDAVALSRGASLEQSISAAKRALEVAENDGHRRQMATSLGILGSFHGLLGEHAVAEKHYLRAVQETEAAVGPDHVGMVSVLGTLAGAYSDQGKHADAERLYRRALEINQKTFGENHPNTVGTLLDLAGLQRKQEDCLPAEASYQRALDINESEYGLYHPAVARVLHDMGSCYFDQGDHERAEPIFRRAIDISEAALVALETESARIPKGVHGRFRRNGGSSKSGDRLSRALAAREASFGGYPKMINSLICLGKIYLGQQNGAKARRAYLRALEVTRTVYGEKHPEASRIAALLESAGSTRDKTH